MTTSRAQKVLVSGCRHCDVISHTPQIRRIRYQSVVALLSPIVQSTADMSISDISVGLTAIQVYIHCVPKKVTPKFKSL